MRVELTHTYDKEFPTLEETAAETESASNDASKKKGDGGKGGSSADSGGRSGMRTWTDRSGKHHIEAKFLGMEGGKVKLEKANGQILRIPPTSLCDEDRHFIGEE